MKRKQTYYTQRPTHFKFSTAVPPRFGVMGGKGEGPVRLEYEVPWNAVIICPPPLSFQVAIRWMKTNARAIIDFKRFLSCSETVNRRLKHVRPRGSALAMPLPVLRLCWSTNFKADLQKAPLKGTIDQRNKRGRLTLPRHLIIVHLYKIIRYRLKL